MNVKVINIIFLIVFSFSCKRNYTREDLIIYVNDPDNGLIKETSINDLRVSIIYKPTDLISLQEIGNKKINEDSLKVFNKKYNNYLFFVLSFSKDNKDLLGTMQNGKDNFNKLLLSLSFNINEYVSAFTDDKQELELIDFNYPRSFGMTNSTDILLVYKKPLAKDSNIKFIINAAISSSVIKFEFNAKNINNCPHINIL